MIKMILAVDDCNGIAKDGKMAWRNKEDFKMFKELTVGAEKNVVVMGRNTWNSIPNMPLPDRVNIMLTSNAKNVNEVSNWNQIIEMSEMCDDLFIIGGASVYEQAIEKGLPEVIYLSKIHGDYECDTFVDYVLDTIYTDYEQTENTKFDSFDLEVWQKK